MHQFIFLVAEISILTDGCMLSWKWALLMFSVYSLLCFSFLLSYAYRALKVWLSFIFPVWFWCQTLNAAQFFRVAVTYFSANNFLLQLLCAYNYDSVLRFGTCSVSVKWIFVKESSGVTHTLKIIFKGLFAALRKSCSPVGAILLLSLHVL